jgi:ABC-type nitrate/sulfonate/bicarbonate transport system ATPase subunit
MRMEHKREVEDIMIDCSNIKKTFETAEGKNFEVIGDISLKVHKNEFLVLFGPGQCGKTTMINIIAGLEPPTKGTVIVNGKKVTAPGADRGVVYQTISLFPWLTTMGNVEYGPKIRGIGKAERRKKAQYYIDLVGLSGFENTYPVKLSGGMKQRVGIARAYCNEPDVLLMDEPFGALDAQTRYLMQKEIEIIWEKEKRTVVFVTNNIEEALYLADRIIVLSNCPAMIKAEYEINLPRPRSYVDREFLRLRKEITSIVDQTK